MRLRINWSHPIAARWRNALFEHVRAELRISRRALYEEMAKLHRASPDYQDDTLLIEIAKQHGIQIPKQLWRLGDEMNRCFDESLLTIAAPDRKSRRRRMTQGRRPERNPGTGDEPTAAESESDDPRVEASGLRGPGGADERPTMKGVTAAPNERHTQPCLNLSPDDIGGGRHLWLAG